MKRIPALAIALLALVAAEGVPCSAQHGVAATSETIVVNAQAPTTPLPHFWEQMFGSGRAILSLRDDYRHDLRHLP